MRTSTDLAWPTDYYGVTNHNFQVFFTTPKNTPSIEHETTSQASGSLSTPEVLIHLNDSDFNTLGEGLSYGDKNATLGTSKVIPVRPENDLSNILQHSGNLPEHYPTDSLKKFYEYCNQVLVRSNPKNAPTQEALYSYKLLNFVALTLLRATVKNQFQLTAGFLKIQYRENIGSFIGPSMREKFTPPCARCLAQSSMYLNKARPEISSFMAKLVMLSTLDDRDIKTYLDASVLTHTSWNGLGILSMIFDICQFFSKSWVELY